MTRFQKIVVGFFMLMGLLGMGLRMTSYFASPPPTATGGRR